MNGPIRREVFEYNLSSPSDPCRALMFVASYANDKNSRTPVIRAANGVAHATNGHALAYALVPGLPCGVYEILHRDEDSIAVATVRGDPPKPYPVDSVRINPDAPDVAVWRASNLLRAEYYDETQLSAALHNATGKYYKPEYLTPLCRYASPDRIKEIRGYTSGRRRHIELHTTEGWVLVLMSMEPGVIPGAREIFQPSAAANTVGKEAAP